MIIAAIAYQELSNEQQTSITDILTSHPEYDRHWRTDYEQVKNDVELGLYLFIRASVWPDEIRSGKHPEHQYNAPKWHYMNYELRFPYDGEVKVAIVCHLSQNKKNLYLSWLLTKHHNHSFDKRYIPIPWLRFLLFFQQLFEIQVLASQYTLDLKYGMPVYNIITPGTLSS